MDGKTELLVQLGFYLHEDFTGFSGLFPGVFAGFPTLGAEVLIFLLSGPQIDFYASVPRLLVEIRETPAFHFSPIHSRTPLPDDSCFLGCGSTNLIQS